MRLVYSSLENTVPANHLRARKSESFNDSEEETFAPLNGEREGMDELKEGS
jgi:hypothetical protein